MSKKKKTNESAVRLKHILLLKKILGVRGTGKKLEIGRLMKELGYTKAYAKNPKQLLNTKDWKGLMEEHLSDDDLAKKHQQLLNKITIDHYIYPASESDKEIKKTFEKFGLSLIRIRKQKQWKRAYFSIMDGQAASRALDMAYKLKGKYGDITIQHKFGELSDEELEGEIAEIISEALRLAERKG